MNRRKNKTFIITERYNYYGTITKTVSSSRHATVLYIAFYHNVCHSNYCLGKFWVSNVVSRFPKFVADVGE